MVLCPTWRAGAGVAVFSFLTCATILARKGLALSANRVAVLTVWSKEALNTLTEIGVHQIDQSTVPGELRQMK